jgi:hypothetical protein
MQRTLFRMIGFGFCFLVLLLVRVDTSAQEPLKLVVPGAPWTIVFPAAGFEMESAKISADGRKGYFVVSDKEAGVSVSFFVEPAAKCKTSRECRDMVQRIGFAHLGKVENVATYEMGDVSVIECFVAEVNGTLVRQQSLLAEFVDQEYWVDMHISKVNYNEEDCDLFDRLVKAAAFVSKAKDK